MRKRYIQKTPHTKTNGGPKTSNSQDWQEEIHWMLVKSLKALDTCKKYFQETSMLQQGNKSE